MLVRNYCLSHFEVVLRGEHFVFSFFNLPLDALGKGGIEEPLEPRPDSHGSVAART